MRIVKKLINLGVPDGMGPEEIKYIQMSNVSTLLMISITVPYAVLCLLNSWLLVFFELLGFITLLVLTNLLNNRKRHLLALVYFGTLLNLHLVFVTIAMGRESGLQLLIFFIAGGTSNLFRRDHTLFMIFSFISIFAMYHLALFLEGIFGPFYQLSEIQITILRHFVVYNIFALIIVNGLTGRIGANSAEDQLLIEKQKSEELFQRLKEQGRKKTQFFHNIAHELRTPLSLIIGPLNNLLRNDHTIDKAELQPQLQMMMRNTRRLLRLTNQLLDLNRLDAGKVRLKPQKGSLPNYLQELVHAFKATAQQQEIHLEMENASGDSEIWYDQEVIERIISNLLSNAIKFTPRNGMVKLTVSDNHAKGNIIISVKDSGMGIPSLHLKNIFDRFYQADGSITRSWGGTGIGLGLVKELVELYGGAISVESKPAEGTEFTVTLPKLAEPANQSNEEDSSVNTFNGVSVVELENAGIPFSHKIENDNTPYPGNNESLPLVLIVEDNNDMREYIRRCLVSCCRVIEAIDGNEGLSKAKEFMPSLIICDIMMPNKDGYDFCREMQKEDNLRLIPIIFLTARTSSEAIIEGFEAGAVGYIAKPFAQDVLLAKVATLLQREAVHEEISLRDGLTGLFNRASWKRWSQRELKRLERSGGSASLVFLDLDDFKMINDTYGHQAGDKVLMEFANTLLNQLRETDLAGRYGGEEFVLFLPDSNREAAVMSLERILDHFQKMSISEFNIHCSFSAGVAEIDGRKLESLAEYVRRADEAMYSVKLQGKRRVSCWEEPT